MFVRNQSEYNYMRQNQVSFTHKLIFRLNSLGDFNQNGDTLINDDFKNCERDWFLLLIDFLSVDQMGILMKSPSQDKILIFE